MAGKWYSANYKCCTYQQRRINRWFKQDGWGLRRLWNSRLCRLEHYVLYIDGVSTHEYHEVYTGLKSVTELGLSSYSTMASSTPPLSTFHHCSPLRHFLTGHCTQQANLLEICYWRLWQRRSLPSALYPMHRGHWIMRCNSMFEKHLEIKNRSNFTPRWLMR